MNYGARLIIPGTILGSIVLVLLLLALTASFTYPAAAHAAGPANPPAPQGSISTENNAGNDPNSIGILTAADPSTLIGVQGEGCQVSQSYPESILQWCDLITRYARAHNLEPDLIAGLIWQESGGDPVAYSKSGAVGLMQVMPKDGLAASFNCPNGPCFSGRPTIEQLQDPEYNIAYGTKMLADLLGKYGNLRDALRSYGPMDVGYYYADKVLGIFNNYSNN